MPPSSAVPVLAIGIATACAAFIVYRSWVGSQDDEASSQSSQAPSPSLVNVPLSNLESGFLVVPSIATVSFYDGAPPTALPQRVRAILEANPFLRARLSPLGDDSGRVSAAYNEPATGKPLDIHPYYEEISTTNPDLPPGLLRGASYSDIVEAAQPYIVGSGETQLGSGGPLFKVTLLRLLAREGGVGGSFAIFVSLSHILGDGSTFYRIHNMLAPGSDIGFMDRSLVDISREASRALGDAEASFLESDAVARSFRLNVVKPAHSHLAWVNQEAIRCRKDEESVRGFELSLSTNDILASAFFEASGCDVGCMAMNLRGRLPGVDISNAAGNYETTIPYVLPDFHPAAIRLSVRGPHVYQRPSAASSLASNARPGTLPASEVLAAGRLSVVSNLASFYDPGSMILGEECTLSLHLVLRPTNAVAWRDSLFVFRSNDRLGVVCAGRGVCRSAEALRSSAFGRYLEPEFQ